MDALKEAKNKDGFKDKTSSATPLMIFLYLSSKSKSSQFFQMSIHAILNRAEKAIFKGVPIINTRNKVLLAYSTLLPTDW